MPFTFSHPALILPFLKSRKLSASGLIVGSMSPDFEYFFRMKMQSEISHTFVGIFLIDFPLAFLVLFVFHQIIKKPLIENSPPFLQKRMQGLKDLNWIKYFKTNLFTVFISLFLGAFSHLLWDAITHWDGLIVEYFPVLKIKILDVPCYTIAQYLSSIMGLIGIGFYIFKLTEEIKDTKIVRPIYWVFTLFFALAFIAIRFYFGRPLNQFGNAIVSILSPIILAITLSSLVFGGSNKN